MNKNGRSVVGTGIISILMVFLLLCLITFAVLTLSSAKADLQYSQQTAERTKNYYAAELRVSQMWKKIDEELQESYNNSEEKVGQQICFSEQIDEVSVLEVELRVCDPQQADGERYQIQRWQTVYDGKWEPEENLSVMQK